MTDAPRAAPWRTILRQAWPILVSSWAGIVFAVLDTAMVGHASAADLQAMSLGASVYITVFVGLMGVVADAALAAGGKVIGVIPRLLMRRELVHRGLTELVVTESMQERKSKMAELSDAFAALPGGIGTLEELFETWTGGFLGEHDKPVVLLDADGFYQPMLRWLDTLHAEGFVAPSALERLLVAGSVADAVTLVTRQ